MLYVERKLKLLGIGGTVCLFYTTKLDNELFNKAVNAYVTDQKKNLANLSKYTKEMGVYKKVMTVMEVLLNG